MIRPILLMIRPILLYCYTLQPSLPKGTRDKLQFVQDKASRAIAMDSGIIVNWDSIEMTCKQRIVVDVFKILNNLAPKIFENQFNVMDHEKNTRGNKCLLKLPKSRTETGRKRFGIQGALIFNDLAKDIRDEKGLLRLKSKLRAVNI